MSEAAETPKKKKSPLPIVVALVLVLAGGGFFMTKGKGEVKEDKSVIKLAKEVTEFEEEYLVNLGDGVTYLRTKIAVKMVEGFEAHTLEANMAAVDDAIIRTLRSVKPDQLRTDADMIALKRKLASAMNHILAGGEGHGEEGHGKVTQIRRKVDESELPDDWDSSEGPVLQVFFKTFATQ